MFWCFGALQSASALSSRLNRYPAIARKLQGTPGVTVSVL